MQKRKDRSSSDRRYGRAFESSSATLAVCIGNPFLVVGVVLGQHLHEVVQGHQVWIHKTRWLSLPADFRSETHRLSSCKTLGKAPN
jgi:hypothetical protein